MKPDADFGDAVTKLCSKFPEHKFELCKPSPFILEIINITDDIILCYNVQEKINGTVQSESMTSQSTITEGLSCRGNPLEVPSCLETSLLSLTIVDSVKPIVKKTYHYYPLSSHQALRVKGFYNMKLNVSAPIVILCEGDVKLVQNGHCRSVNRVLHCSSFSGSWKTTCWSDYYKMESSLVEPLSQLHENHFKKVSSSDGKKSQCDVRFKAKSVLKKIDDINDISEKCCIVSALLEWNTPTVKPPPDNTDVSLLLDVNFSRSPSDSLCIIWRQLILLQNYLDYLEKKSKDSSPGPLPSASSLLDDLGIVSCDLNEVTVDNEMLKLLFEHVDAMPSVLNKDSITLQQLTDFFANINYSNSDLTNALWTKLLGCDSFELLQLCFKHFFKHVRTSTRSKSIKKTNITRLAQMIQVDQMVLDSYVQLINPVEYLIEIGLEKLRQVFIAIFDCLKVSSSSLNMPTLPKFPEVANSDDWMKVSKSWLSWLTRLYASLNILCCAEMALGDPQFAAFYPVVCKVISQLSSNDTNSMMKIDSLVSLMEKPQQTISIKIPMTLLSTSTVDTEFLDEWSLTLTTSTKSRKVESIFYRSPFCPIPYVNEDNTFDGNELNNVTQLNTTYGVNTTLCAANITACLDNVSCLLHCVESHKITDNFPFSNRNV